MNYLDQLVWATFIAKQAALPGVSAVKFLRKFDGNVASRITQFNNPRYVQGPGLLAGSNANALKEFARMERPLTAPTEMRTWSPNMPEGYAQSRLSTGGQPQFETIARHALRRDPTEFESHWPGSVASGQYTGFRNNIAGTLRMMRQQGRAESAAAARTSQYSQAGF